MTTSSTVMDDRRIERIVHEALGRQLRTMSLLALLLGVLGFFAGHFVAASYSRQNNERLEARLAEVQGQIGVLTDRCNRMDRQHAQVATNLLDVERLRQNEVQRDIAALRSIMDSIDERRTASLRDLDTYVTRRLYVPPQAVTAAMNRLVDDQLLQMDRVLANVERRLPDAVRPTPPAQTANQEWTAAPPPPVEPDAVGSADMTGRGPVPEQAIVVRQPDVAETPEAETQLFAPPPRKGFLFISRSQPERLDATRVSESGAIPLPPR